MLCCGCTFGKNENNKGNGVIEAIGWIGAVCFATCALPQAIKSYKDGTSRSISILFLGLWVVGEVLTLAYILFTTMQLPLIVNYVFNLLCLAVILYYYFYPRDSNGLE